MTDCIELRGLRVLAYCGVLPEEQDRPQPLELDLDLVADLTAAGSSDDLADTIDYGAVLDTVVAHVTRARVALLEHLAAGICATLLVDPRVLEVTVAVRKLRPPVAHQLASTGVRVTRGR